MRRLRFPRSIQADRIMKAAHLRMCRSDSRTEKEQAVAEDKQWPWSQEVRIIDEAVAKGRPEHATMELVEGYREYIRLKYEAKRNREARERGILSFPVRGTIAPTDDEPKGRAA